MTRFSGTLRVLLIVLTISCSASGEMGWPLDDKRLVSNSDIVLAGEQVDAVTVKVARVLKGTWTADSITLPELARYTRLIDSGEKAGPREKVASGQIIIFIDGRTVPCSLVYSGVKRFSAKGDGAALYQYVSPQGDTHLVLQRDAEGRTEGQYVGQLEKVIKNARDAYSRIRQQKLASTDFSSDKSVFEFMYWAYCTRWGYEDGMQELLRLADSPVEKTRGGAVAVLSTIRDPGSGAGLREIVERSLTDGASVFDHIRAVGAIGGDEAVPLLVRLSFPHRHAHLQRRR